MPESIHIDLLRHGETEIGSRFRGSIDDPLTDKGWQQMRKGIELLDKEWDHCITSPLIRCADFAKEVVQKRCVSLSFDNRLKELHFGMWEGKYAEEIMEEDRDALVNFWKDPVTYTPPGAEPLLDFEKRVLASWQQIIDDLYGKKVLIVTHGGVISSILCHLNKKPINQILEYQVSHANVTRIEIDRSLNKTVIDGVTV